MEILMYLGADSNVLISSGVQYYFYPGNDTY